jgi:hypothetical protein
VFIAGKAIGSHAEIQKCCEDGTLNDMLDEADV